MTNEREFGPFQIGDWVETSVWVAGQQQPMAAGQVVSVHDGYCSVDVMSHHGGAPWVLDKNNTELRRIDRPPASV